MGSAVLAGTTGAWLAIEDGVVAQQGVTATHRAEATRGGRRRLLPGVRGHPDERARCRRLLAGRPGGVAHRGPRDARRGSHVVPAHARELPATGTGTRSPGSRPRRPTRRRSGLPRIEGVHLEGPFLGDAPGAHPTDLLGPVDVDWLVDLLDSQPGLVRLVTIAPEADPELRGTRALVERGVKVSLGHSRCTYEQALAVAARRGDARHPPLQRHGPPWASGARASRRRARRRPPDAEPDPRLRARAPRWPCAWPHSASRAS